MDSRHSRRARWRGLAILIGTACLAGGAARADKGDVVNFSVAASQAHDDNVFRLSPTTDPLLAIGSSEKSDTTTTTTVGVTVDKTIGLQRLKLDTQISAVRYRRFRLLDHEPNQIDATWQWQLGNRLRGELSSSRKQSITGFGDFRTPVKNIKTLESRNGSIYLRFGADWEGFVGAVRGVGENSNAAQITDDSRTDTKETGLRYGPASGNWLRWKLRQTDARYPNQQITAGSRVDNSYLQRDIEMDGGWQLTGASRVSGMVGQSRRRHDDMPVRDYSGPTGRIAWDWQPTGKSTLNVTARRSLSGNSDDISNYVVTRGLVVAPSWYPTARTSLQLSLEQSRRGFGGDPGFILTAVPKREDEIRATTLSASYAPHRALSLSLSLRDEKRDSNYAGLAYRDRTTWLSAQFSF